MKRTSLTTRQLINVIFDAVGSRSSMLRNSLLLATTLAILRGVLFFLFFPLFIALDDGNHELATSLIYAMVAILIVSSLADWYSRSWDYNGNAGRASDELRRKIGMQLRQIPLEDLYQKRSGETAAAVAGNVDDVINYTGFVATTLLLAIITPIVVGIGLFWYSWPIALLLLLLFPAVIPIYFAARPLMNRNQDAVVTAHAELNAETIEYTQGLPVLRATGSIGDKSARFSNAVKKVEDTQLISLKDQTVPSILFASSIELGILLIVGVSIWMVTSGNLTAALAAALLVCTVRFSEPLTQVISLLNFLEMVRNGYERLYELQKIAPLPQHTPELTPDSYPITLSNVTFAYKNANTNALNDLSITLPENSMSALVGPSGCGKTTLVRLFMRYADPQHGTVTIGGIDIRQIPPETLNNLIAVVFQEVYLFDDTILANIRMGRADATDDEVITAAKAAQCHDFISALPQGYETRVGDIGNNLSGGEKQRISIARALLKDAPIIVLDEPTAALDTYSELAVQAAIDTLVQNKTVVVIAHRLTTIVGADQIVVLNEGSIEEVGTHEQLLQNESGRYARLWSIQQGDAPPSP